MENPLDDLKKLPPGTVDLARQVYENGRRLGSHDLTPVVEAVAAALRPANPLADAFVTLLLAIPESQRGEVIDAINHNEFFCAHCGFGSIEKPNRNCQCWNDE